ncbi:putative teichoic acid glycosylation protein [Clostridium sp. CAG:343]|jgi:putative flippase GtrA|nr:putative teichoic acid glycosylation protein [Clostridium sp. CAG:343]HCF34383.1 GtrA family protein [Clostridiales bacterium]
MKDIEKIKEVNLKNLNLKTIKGLFLEYKEVINYLVFGCLTTVVNFVCYYLFAKVLGIEEVISSGLSWLFSVLFAYITNKIFVFESKTTTIKEFIMEIISFFLARVLSGILCDVGTFAVMVKVIGINDVVAKLITQIMVVIVNYVLSKWIIFKNR